MRGFVISLCFACALFTTTAVQAGGFKRGSEPDGFRSLTWGSSLPDTGMIYVSTDESYGGIKQYKRESDELKIGGAELRDILYAYWQNRLCTIAISCKGYVNFRALQDATSEQFGRGVQANKYIESYIWWGNVTRMILKYNEVSEEASLLIMSTVIGDELEAWDKKRAREGTKDF